MPKTRLDVSRMALRRLGIGGEGEALTAEQYEHAGEVLDALLSEVVTAQNLTITWTTDTVPDAVYLPLAYLLAADLAPHYEIQPRDSRAAMIGRIRSYVLTDDREDRADVDDDLTVSAAEVELDLRAQYF